MDKKQNDLSNSDTDYQKMIDDLYQSLKELSEIHKQLKKNQKS